MNSVDFGIIFGCIFEPNLNEKMFLKLSAKILFIAIELFLAFYSIAISDSLLVKFLFFAVTALIVAFGITKLISKLLPIDKDHTSIDPEEEEL